MAEEKSTGRRSRKHNPDKPPTDDPAELELIKTVREHLVRFSGLANGGGIIATISVLGATAKDGDIANILSLPLASFSAGVICALLHTLQAFFAAADISTEHLKNRKFPLNILPGFIYKYQAWCVLGMPAFFVIGCFFGVIIISFA